ncbi:hypothetical protein ACJZ2D_014939 [Fusarium nematophilum]
MSSTRYTHICNACGRPRSKGFQRRHPLSQGDPLTQSICRRCRPIWHNNGNESRERAVWQKSQSQSVRGRLRRAIHTITIAGKNLVRALTSQEGLNIHVHHHHWHHDSGTEVYQDGSRVASPRAQSTANGNRTPVKQPYQEATELADGPGPALCELSADQPSAENPPPVGPKPALFLRGTNLVD